MAKILHLSNNFIPYNIGGTELYVYNLAKAQQNSGHQVRVFCHGSKATKNSLTKETIHNIDVHFISPDPNESVFKKATSTAALLKKCIENFVPDVIHIHHLGSLYFGVSSKVYDIIANECVFPSKTRLVLTIHDWWYFCDRTQYIKTNHELCHNPHFLNCLNCHKADAKSIISKLYFPVIWHNKRAQSQKLFELSTKIIFASNTIKKDYLRVFKISQHKIKVTPHGMQFNTTQNALKPTTSSTPIKIGYIGHMGKHKGVHILIEALSHIPPDQYRCEIYGTPTKGDYVDKLKEQSARNPSINLKGYFEERDKQSIMKGFSIIVIPSLGHESFCFVLWEALAAGIPVIAPDFGIFDEFLRGSPSAILFKRNNAYDLAEHLRKVIRGDIKFKPDTQLLDKLMPWPRYSEILDNEVYK